MVDSFNVLIEPKDVFNIPIIGDLARNANNNITAARYDEKNENDIVGIPIAIPLLPKRNYFLFGKPIDTTIIDHNNLIECKNIYNIIQNDVRKGIDDLLIARTYDEYNDNTIKRITYERIFNKQAPTFPIDILNKENN